MVSGPPGTPQSYRVSDPDPLKNQKATKQAFNVGLAIIDPPVKHHLNDISLVG